MNTDNHPHGGGWRTEGAWRLAMTLVSSFLEPVQQLAYVMTTPTFNTLVTVLSGWIFARRRTVTGLIVAAEAVGTKHHSCFHRLFAKAA